MKALIALGAAAIVATAAISPANAAQGCGPGFHRAPSGMCRPNRGPMGPMGPGQVTWVEGRYYAGHGYWWHNRWYHHRQRRNGIWIYL